MAIFDIFEHFEFFEFFRIFGNFCVSEFFEIFRNWIFLIGYHNKFHPPIGQHHQVSTLKYLPPNL